MKMENKDIIIYGLIGLVVVQFIAHRKEEQNEQRYSDARYNSSYGKVL